MTVAFLPCHLLVPAVAVVLASLCSWASPARAIDPINLQITSSAPLKPGGNPQFPRGTAPFGSTVTFQVAAAGNSYEDLQMGILCSNTTLDPSSVSPAPVLVDTTGHGTQINWLFHDTGSGTGTFTAVAGVVEGNAAVSCQASVFGHTTDPAASGSGNAFYTVELTTAPAPPTAKFTATV